VTTWVLILVPALVLPIVLLFSFAGCTLVAPLDEHTAAQPRFTPSGAPRCTIGAKDVTCKGTIMGLGSESVEVRLDVTGFWRYRCNQQARPELPFSDSVRQTYSANTFTNGQLEFTSTYTFAEDLTQANCPAATTPSFRDMWFTSITLTISQNGRLLFTCRTIPGSPLQAGQTVLLECGP